MAPTAPSPKPCFFVASSRKDLASFPEDVRAEFGHALHEAQCGLEPHIAKALKGFGGRSVLELIEDHDGDTYRAVLHGTVLRCRIRPPLLSEEGEDRHRHSAA